MKFEYKPTLLAKLETLAKHAKHVASLLAQERGADREAYKKELDRLLEGVEKIKREFDAVK
mgnify:CR=1 FL=1|jgi:hypothetical protein|tara:strand:+ start:501 stop:683 length:183 start_codon:yes stop_codon:yes gene_type:complete